MFSWQIFVVAVVLGVIQFGFGILIGKIIYNRRKQQIIADSPTTTSESLKKTTKNLEKLTARIQSTVGRVTSDVSNHQVRIEQMTRELHAMRQRSVSITEEVIWERLNQMLRMTTDFSRRLTDAEAQLKTQQQQIKTLESGGTLDDTQNPEPAEHQNPYSTAENVHSHSTDTYETATEDTTATSQNEDPDEVNEMLDNVRVRLNEVVHSGQPSDSEN
ncbi:MAG: hypothetical protein PVH19_12525 [Planctomycetia bacterium]|jgi:hypothetical protein